MKQLIISLISIAVGFNVGYSQVIATPTIDSAKKETILGVADLKIVPGKRVGAIVRTTTKADLVKLFGRKNLADSKFVAMQGAIERPATLIKLGKNKSIQVVWANNDHNRVFSAIVRDPDWRTSTGIHVGMSFPALRKIVGKFTVNGLGWDYGHKVSFDRQDHPVNNGMTIDADADKRAIAQFPKDYQAVKGDAPIDDKDLRWKNLKMHISQIDVILGEPK